MNTEHMGEASFQVNQMLKQRVREKENCFNAIVDLCTVFVVVVVVAFTNVLR